MSTDYQSVPQRPLIRSWTFCLVRKAMKGYEVETAMLDSVVDRICSRTTTRDPDYLLRSRKYIRNSGLLMNCENWKQFTQDVWNLVCRARAQRDKQLFMMPIPESVRDEMCSNEHFEADWSDLSIRTEFLNAKVGDVVNGWVKTDFGWM